MAKGDETRSRICEAAIRVASRDGMQALTIDNVAAEASLSKGGVMHHFRSKEQLLEGAVAHFGTMVEAALSAEVANDPHPRFRWARAFLKVGFGQSSTDVPPPTDKDATASPSLIQPGGMDRFVVAMVAASVHHPQIMKPVVEFGQRLKQRLLSDPNDGMDTLMIWLMLDGLFFWQHLGFLDRDDPLRERIAKELARRVGELSSGTRRSVIGREPKVKPSVGFTGEPANRSPSSKSTARTARRPSTRAQKSRSGAANRIGLFSLLAVFVLSAAAFVYHDEILALFRPKAPEATNEPTEKPRRRVHSLGRLEPTGTVIQLAAPSGNEGARVERLLVREGEDVSEGQVIALMDMHSRRSAVVAEAQANLETAKNRATQVRLGAKSGDIQSAKASYQSAIQQQAVAKRDLDRALPLAKRNNLTEEELDSRQWAFDRATKEVERTKGLLESVSEVREIDVKVADASVAAAQAALETATANLEATQVKSPSKGKILKIYARAGEKIGERGLVELGQVEQMQAVAEIYEGDANQVRKGQLATIILDSTREKFEAVVDEVGYMVARKVVLTNDPISDSDARILEVRLNLTREGSERVARLSNARVEVSIDVDELEPEAKLSAVQNPMEPSPR